MGNTFSCIRFKKRKSRNPYFGEQTSSNLANEEICEKVNAFEPGKYVLEEIRMEKKEKEENGKQKRDDGEQKKKDGEKEEAWKILDVEDEEIDNIAQVLGKSHKLESDSGSASKAVPVETAAETLPASPETSPTPVENKDAEDVVIFSKSPTFSKYPESPVFSGCGDYQADADDEEEVEEEPEPVRRIYHSGGEDWNAFDRVMQQERVEEEDEEAGLYGDDGWDDSSMSSRAKTGFIFVPPRIIDQAQMLADIDHVLERLIDRVEAAYAYREVSDDEYDRLTPPIVVGDIYSGSGILRRKHNTPKRNIRWAEDVKPPASNLPEVGKASRGSQA